MLGMLQSKILPVEWRQIHFLLGDPVRARDPVPDDPVSSVDEADDRDPLAVYFVPGAVDLPP